MGKHKPPAARNAGRSEKDSNDSTMAALVVGGTAIAIVAALAAFMSFSEGSGPEETHGIKGAPQAPAASEQPLAPLKLLATGALQGFSEEHNASLLWGTYRPGVYFGLRSHTAPTALAAGLMWVSASAPRMDKMRHKCEQDEVERYGFSSHDGRGFGVQPIVDPANGISLETSFVATGGGGWAVRVAGSAPSGGGRAQRQSLFFYLSVDAELATDGDAAGAFKRPRARPFLGAEGVIVSGEVRGLGKFSLMATAREGGGKAAKVHAWGSARPGDSHLNVADVVRRELEDRGGEEQGGNGARGRLTGGVAPGSRLLVLQVTAAPPFELDLTLAPEACADDDDAPCKVAHRDFSGDGLGNLLQKRQAAFERAVDERLLGGGESQRPRPLMLRGKPLDADARAFAAHALAALLGSTGFFHGTATVAPSPSGAGGGVTPAVSLLAVVPSRPFFPRGFLWDEGFHQLVVGAWDPDLSDHIISGWLGLMHVDGWIPREQILGAEAVARVPPEFLAQHREHANPPALLLRLQRLLDAAEGGGETAGGGGGVREGAPDGARSGIDGSHDWLPRLRALWPWLVRWHKWFLRTQSGEAAHSFRWRGRDPNDNRLNAMTLSSGLDDYPRATVPSPSERHVDLHCWVAFFSRLLAQLASRLGMVEEHTRYKALFEAQLGSLIETHWSPSAGAFCDVGKHANSGKFVDLFVVKCATPDGRDMVEHAVPDPQRPACPRSHPRFMFPLGDGQGGLLTRQSFSPRGLRQQFVEHLGYVSLFPLMLRLLPAHSPQLLPLIELLRDPTRLWSDHGVRSLSKADPWYGRQNAPGDEPYWRGPIWVNLNYLLLCGLHHYAGLPGPAQARAATVYAELRENLVGTMLDEWRRTGYLWEQYSPDSGRGQRTHPFNGWSSLALLALAEIY
jgi:mannosyl-oligosaccharide glucosidase